MFHVVEDYCGTLAIHVMGEKGWRGVIRLPSIWCISHFYFRWIIVFYGHP